MTGNLAILPVAFPAKGYGTIHVWPCQDGFEVAHESGSGSSWGWFDRHERGEAAIQAAFALNRDEMDGGCDVAICPEAIADMEKHKRPMALVRAVAF